MLSSVAFLELIETVAGNPLYQAIYTASADSIPALTFYVAGALAAISLCLTVLIHKDDVLHHPIKVGHEFVNGDSSPVGDESLEKSSFEETKRLDEKESEIVHNGEKLNQNTSGAVNSTYGAVNDETHSILRSRTESDADLRQQ